MEQQGYLRIFRERWVALVLGVLVGLGAALGVSAAIQPTYEATATSFLSVQSDVGTLLERSQFALARISSYPELAVSSDVLSSTITDLGLKESVQQLAKSVTATNPPTTVLLQITASAHDPETAAAIANSIAVNLSDTVSQLENSTSDDRYTVSLELRDRAQAPATPSAPQRGIILGLGALGGLALGLIAAIIWARLDRTVRSTRDARSISGLPVIGQLPKPLWPFGRPRAGFLDRTEEALREAQLTIKQANGGEMPKLLAFVPAGRRAGELQARIGFARVFAATGHSVVLVESDFTGGIGTVAPEAVQMEGLAEVLAGTRTVPRLVLKSDVESFDLLPAGLPQNAPKESVAERNIRSVVRQLAADFDTTVTQVTSVSRPATLELVAPYADGVVVFVRFGRTRAADLAHVLSRLRLLEVRPLGIVMTGVPRYRQSDLVAEWRPDDFNEVPRSPARSWGDPLAIETSEIPVQDAAPATPEPEVVPEAVTEPDVDEHPAIVIEPLVHLDEPHVASDTAPATDEHVTDASPKPATPLRAPRAPRKRANTTSRSRSSEPRTTARQTKPTPDDSTPVIEPDPAPENV